MTSRGDPPDRAVLDPHGVRRRHLPPPGHRTERMDIPGLPDDACDPVQAVEPSTTFSADALQGACERLSAGDGLHGLLARFGGDEARDCRLPLPARATSPGLLRRHRASLLVVAYGVASVIYIGVEAILTVALYRLFVEDWLARVVPPALAANLAWGLAALIIALTIAGIVADLRATRLAQPA